MSTHPGIDVGALGPAELSHVVVPEDTASALGSGDLAVLGTPKVLALAEAACVAVVVEHLDAELTSVGTEVHLQHLAATPVGSQVTATARLDGADGRALDFSVELRDAAGTVLAEGTLRRVVVHRQRFMDRLARPEGDPS